MACTSTSRCPRDEGGCTLCGCDWDYELGKCLGSSDPCSSFSSQSDCEICGCDWTIPGINIKINIGDVWKDGLEMKVNIGDVWKDAIEIWQNIGDVWKRVF